MLELEVEAEWSQEGPTLSNDIWKKFQLIPTPPRSPSHDTDLGHTELSSLGLIEDLSPLDLTSLLQDHDFGVDLDTLDNLDNLDHIDLLPDHLAGCGGPGGLPCAHGTCTSCTQLALAGSELRHDCMWRGTCTAEAHAYHSRDLHHHHHHTHRDSTSNLPELLMDTSSALECAAGFTHLHDLDEEDDEDDNLDDMDVDDDLSARPDTPSESSETDTDEEDQEDEDDDDDEEEEKLEGRQSPPAVHVDHSYYCPRAPSPRPAYAPAMPHTPSESEDEIDVVSLGSPDSAYSSSSSTTTTTTTRVGGEKRKRGGGGGRTSGGDPTTLNPTTPTPAIPSTTTPALPTATATTTFVTTTGSKKVVKIRTSNLPSSPSKASRHRRSSGGSKRRLVTTTDTTTTTNSCSSITHPTTTTTTTSSTVGSLRRTPTSPTTYSSSSSKHKRIRSHHHHHHHGRKRRGHRSDSDDPEKRHLHNSLERMRRVDLRNAFEELRALVPGLCDKDKAPKVEILRRASEHCYSMTQRGRLLEQEKEKQKRLQGELRKRLANLHKQQRLS